MTGLLAARAAAAACVLLVTTPARAHGDLERLGPFYAGMLHPLLVPGQLLALLALGLLVGQRGLAPGRHALTLLLLALTASLALVTAAPSLAAAPWAGALEHALLLIGALAALATLTALPLPRLAVPALALLVGLGVGLGSAPEAATAAAVISLGPTAVRWSGAAGTLIGAFLAVAGVAGLADAARAGWARLGVRVVASWLAASAVLVGALAVLVDRPPATRPQATQLSGSAGDSSAITRPQDQ